MKINYQTPCLLLLTIYDGNAICQASGGGTIGEGGDFIWGETLFTGPEQ